MIRDVTELREQGQVCRRVAALQVDRMGRAVAVEGIMHPDDARRAVDVGATAISVSNHGGNNLDGTPGSIRALPGIVDAVCDQIEVAPTSKRTPHPQPARTTALGGRSTDSRLRPD